MKNGDLGKKKRFSAKILFCFSLAFLCFSYWIFFYVDFVIIILILILLFLLYYLSSRVFQPKRKNKLKNND